MNPQLIFLLAVLLTVLWPWCVLWVHFDRRLQRDREKVCEWMRLIGDAVNEQCVCVAALIHFSIENHHFTREEFEATKARMTAMADQYVQARIEEARNKS